MGSSPVSSALNSHCSRVPLYQYPPGLLQIHYLTCSHCILLPKIQLRQNKEIVGQVLSRKLSLEIHGGVGRGGEFYLVDPQEKTKNTARGLKHSLSFMILDLAQHRSSELEKAAFQRCAKIPMSQTKSSWSKGQHFALCPPQPKFNRACSFLSHLSMSSCNP